jgi:transposase-like protein
MANPYDVAFRERAVAAHEAGQGAYVEVAALFGLDHRTLERWVAQWRTTASVAPPPKSGGWRCPIDLVALRAVVAEAPDATSAELCWAYNRRVARAQRTTPTSFRRAMHRAGFVLKTNGRGRVRSIGRTSTRSGRQRRDGPVARVGPARPGIRGGTGR